MRAGSTLTYNKVSISQPNVQADIILMTQFQPSHTLGGQMRGSMHEMGKKQVTYDELSLPQWAAGQLTNIHSKSDPILVKQAILQMTLAMRDTASLSWAGVKSAWASSMHEVEEGLLTWVNSTQWAINRLSASQAALAQPQLPTASSSTKRPYKFFNEASCLHRKSSWIILTYLCILL